MPVLKYPLFGPYIIEMTSFFKRTFNNYRLSSTQDPLGCQVYYGTPRAAYRRYFDTTNNKLILPMINFYAADSNRKMDKEPVDVMLYDADRTRYPDGRISATKAPAHYETTYQFYMWNNSYRERDAMMHTIITSFPQGALSLLHQPNIQDPSNYLLMPLKLDQTFTDDTEIEGLDMSETRDQIRTTFTIISQAIVPYALIDAYMIKGNIDVNTTFFDPTVDYEFQDNYTIPVTSP